ncbi:acetate--CoA ligase [Candidatus Bathyarchaeota archaeon]|nr:acetate--CoA ligase [Candidatus Bathyarchaeota archaeon]
MKLEAFFKPNAIAVIGASREPEKVGYKILKNLIEAGYKGRIYPINPQAPELMGLKCYKSILEVPENIDLAVIAVPAKIVLQVAEECGKKGVKGLVIISAGFSEVGKEGVSLEKQLVNICRKYGMRLQGPNCLGIINTRMNINASFASATPTLGTIAFISQSGALGSAILNWALENKVGFTSFISLGNEADLEAADFIEAFGEDEETKVIALYIEGVKNGRKIIKVAEEVSRKKPILALKAGVTEVGVKAVASHTGSLAGSETAFSAAFKKAGILRVWSLEELFNLILAFEAQPIPKGDNVLIITNGGGPGILVADACEKNGLKLPPLEDASIKTLRENLPPHASFGNPLDVLGDADEKRYLLALQAGLKSEKINALIVIVTPQAMTPAEKIAEVIAKIKTQYFEKPILTSFMGFKSDSNPLRILKENDVPNYHFPETAAYVLKAMYDYYLILNAPKEEPVEILDLKREVIKNIISKAQQEGRPVLTIDEAIGVAKASNIPTPKAAVARSLEEAVKIASEIGYPLAIKIVSPEIIHKTDVGGVILNVKTPEETKAAYEKIIRQSKLFMPQAKILGVFLQKMMPPGKEVIIGAVRDHVFGPLLMFGLGGIYVNFLRDVSYRLCPLTRLEAKEMIEETKAYILLKGVRGEKPADINALIDAILRVSYLISEFEEIMEIEVNPLVVYEEEKGCIGLDVKVTVKI